jgi:radical SAM/Cys-rich protein
MNRFLQRLENEDLSLRRQRTEILQINTGKICNLTCIHCHVNAGPARKEIITRETIDRILDWYGRTDIPTVDLTGGTPEMIPDFRYLVERLRALPHNRDILDRLNATILLEPGYEWVAPFLAEHRVTLIASMPCYSPENVNEQRGEGVFEKSIQAFRKLNGLGYGIDSGLRLNFVYNPNGDFLPGDQQELEADYKREMKKHFGIEFDELYTITNMPIARYASWLKRHGKLEAYMDLLIGAFNPAAVNGLMCRHTLSIGWRGEVYDCDFNQQLDLQWQNGKALYLWDLDPAELEGREIMTGDHCFGCTAGAGSSCGGSIT